MVGSKRWVPLAASLILLAVVLFLRSQSTEAAANWTVNTGGGNLSTTLLDYHPNNIHIHVGDTVTWDWAIGAPHTVTFTSGAPFPELIVPQAGGEDLQMNPQIFLPSQQQGSYDGQGYVNSGFIQRLPGQAPATYSLTFSQVGTFNYGCALHPFMRGQVVVEPTGAPLPTAEQQLAEGEADRAFDIGIGESHIRASGVSNPAPNSWAIAAGTGTGEVSVDQFLPNDQTTDAGDTVIWQLRNPAEPHAITFLSGETRFEVCSPIAQPSGPPIIALDPRAGFPSVPPGTTAVEYGGTGFLNSGLIGMPGTPKTWTVTFTNPGTYQYVCLLHSEMNGILNVRAKGSWPPVLVDGTAAQNGDQITFSFYVRNTGSSPVSGFNVAIPMPAGTTLVGSATGQENLNPGKIVGDVSWFDQDAVVSPDSSIGPFVITVRVPNGMNITDVKTHAFVTFSRPASGTSASPDIGIGPPFEGP